MNLGENRNFLPMLWFEQELSKYLVSKFGLKYNIKSWGAFHPVCCWRMLLWVVSSVFRNQWAILETRINLSADLYKLHPGKIDCFKTGWSVFAIYQNDVLYLGVDGTPVYLSLQWSMAIPFVSGIVTFINKEIKPTIFFSSFSLCSNHLGC